MKRFLTLSLVAGMALTMMLMSRPAFSQQQERLQQPIAPADQGDKNNNFYDNVEIYPLPGSGIQVDGEIENPGKVDFSGLTLRSVIVKEAELNDDGSNQFIGAYRYDGYSLFDILQDRILKKANKETFPPIIDLYVIIENDMGEKVYLSWGEIYYPNHLHEILIATRVSRIVPSKTKDLWPLPEKSKLVVANDLVTERNISNPVRITVRSFDRDFVINRNLDPLYVPEFSIVWDRKPVAKVAEMPGDLQQETFHTIFYGRGRGIHSTMPFKGVMVKELLQALAPIPAGYLKTGLVAAAGADGYRAIYSLSEIINRNDQEEVLLVEGQTDDTSGKFRLFPACDFFSDRAVKALSELIILPE